MKTGISIVDNEYLKWVTKISCLYRRSQIKAAVKVNSTLLSFYWQLGRDIVSMKAESRWGSGFYRNLSADLRKAIPSAKGFSETNLRYAKYFFEMYSSLLNPPQAGAELQQHENEAFCPQLGDELREKLFAIPWGHHKTLIDKMKDSPRKALFYINKTIENGWSRSMLLNHISARLYEREGKALTNFKATLPAETSGLAQELTKDPYCFDFLALRDEYNERQLKEALLANITSFLIELGTGFAYVGKEYRLQIGETENFIDLLFYNLRLRCYVVIEVKTSSFSPADIGQIGTYVTAANHLLRQEGNDNPTIGLLVCKDKDKLLAQYALESSSQPIGISDYELSRLYPAKVEGTIPSIEEIENKLNNKTK